MINKKVLKLFNYIAEHELIGKKNVINYILTNLVNLKENGDSDEIEIIKKIKKYIISNPDSKKSQFIVNLVSKESYDDIISYLVNIEPLLKKRKLTDDEISLLNPYIEFKNKIIKEE